MKFSKRGFTLIELLVALAIISILIGAAVFVLKPSDYLKKSRDTRRVSDLKVIQTALEQAYGYENTYSASVPTDGSAYRSTDLSVTYLNTTPKDPDSTKSYFYRRNAGCGCAAAAGGYVLCAALEASPGTTGCTITAGQCSAGVPSAAQNYCLTNPF